MGVRAVRCPLFYTLSKRGFVLLHNVVTAFKRRLEVTVLQTELFVPMQIRSLVKFLLGSIQRLVNHWRD